MITIKSLSGISFDQIFETHLKAFKDYPFQWSKEALKKTIERRGYDPSLSFGAFYNNELVSFTLNGTGQFNGIKTAYDTGTGTVEEFRGKGLASKIFEYSVPFLKEKNIRQYILEVLEENEKAISVYSKQGFGISRKFECFIVNSNEWTPAPTVKVNEAELKEIDFSFRPEMESMMDFKLSWQNDFQALNKEPGNFKIIGAFYQNRLSGYGIIEPETGDIPQLAIDRNFRRRGIGTMILLELKKLNRAAIAKVVNIESGQDGIISFLSRNKIPKIVSQFEMTKQL